MALANQLQAALSGRYTIVRELGGGGMSRVFVAEETQLGRRVVVKVLAPELAQAISVERFEREIRLAASLQHAHIVPVLSNGEVDGLPYFIMPFIDGESLRARVLRGSIPIGECVSILRDVARALAYAHGRDVIHRDIKPDNVMFSAGSAVVTDFGIAKAIHAARSGVGSETLTQLGTSIGTPAYMAPEQAAGDPALDARADLYAFGCTAYELLSGSSPFAGRTPQRMLAAHMTEAPRPIRDIRPDTPPLLADLVMRCLAKDAGARPVSASEIARTLDNVTSGSTTSTPAILLGGPAMFRRALLIYVAAFAAVAILAKAAIVGIGLPDWVFPGAILVMALGLPMILFTAYVQRVNRQLVTATPTLTPGGTASLNLPAGTMATIAVRATPWVSWRRVGRGGAFAIGGFVALVAVFMAMRATGIGPFGSLMASGKVADRARVLVADFSVVDADTGLGAVLKDMTRTSLAQSSIIRVAPTSYIPGALKRMKLPDTLHVHREVARDMAARDGIALIVDGSITGAGGGYIVVMKLIQAASNTELVSVQETGDGVRGLVAAVDRSTRKLRDHLGESLRNLQQTPALSAVTTGSLDALREYTEGSVANDADDYSSAIVHLRKAVTLDTTFPEAWRKLAVALSNRGDRQSAIDSAMQRAYDLRLELPHYERTFLEASYFALGPGRDRAKGLAIYRTLLPARGPMLNMAELYASRRDFAVAESLLRERIKTSSVVMGRSDLAQILIERDNLPAADSVLAALPASAAANAVAMDTRADLLVNRGDLVRLAHLIDSARASADTTIRNWADARQVLSDVLHGELLAAHTVMNLQGDSGLRRATVWALVEAIAGGQPQNAARDLDAALVRYPLHAIAQDDRPDLDVAAAYAISGRPDRARAIVAAFQSELTDTSLRRWLAPSVHTTLGEIAVAEHHTDDAVREFRLGDRAPDGPVNECAACLPLELARAFDAGGRVDSAIAMFEAYLKTRQTSHGVLPVAAAPIMVAYAHRRLGDLYEAKGDDTDAAKHYRAFINLYKNADPDLQPVVSSVRLRLAHLGDTAPSTSLPKP